MGRRQRRGAERRHRRRRTRHHHRGARRGPQRQGQAAGCVVQGIVGRDRAAAGQARRERRGDRRLHRRRHRQVDATEQHRTTAAGGTAAAHRREDPAAPRQRCVRQVQLQSKNEVVQSRQQQFPATRSSSPYVHLRPRLFAEGEIVARGFYRAATRNRLWNSGCRQREARWSSKVIERWFISFQFKRELMRASSGSFPRIFPGFGRDVSINMDYMKKSLVIIAGFLGVKNFHELWSTVVQQGTFSFLAKSEIL